MIEDGVAANSTQFAAGTKKPDGALDVILIPRGAGYIIHTFLGFIANRQFGWKYPEDKSVCVSADDERGEILEKLRNEKRLAEKHPEQAPESDALKRLWQIALKTEDSADWGPH